ncbi:MAG: ABC transporter ATP-binding protein [Nitrospirae bacterium GWB2_47_37]|nr:MAG: ABC transporter ATP-binding protein [Nitrospirae bacterium GWB2_47_37]
MQIVSVENLSIRYNSTDVFSGVTLAFNAGDYVALAGPNGSGKSTLIKAMLGLIEPAAGSVRIFGASPAGFTDWQRVGYIPQRLVSFSPYFPATVKEVVSMGLLSGKKFPKRLSSKDSAAIDRALSLMDIAALKDKKIGELSGGQQQRVIIARAVINEPELLILDEPTTAVDPETREKFFGVIGALNKSNGTTVILITHDTGSAGKYASKLLYFDRRVVFFGTFKDFCESPNMAEYFGPGSQHLICHRHD